MVDVDTPSASGPRLLIAPTYVSGLTADQLPLRVRIVMPAGGVRRRRAQAIRVKALLDPPPAPAAPGAYDFARDAWFEGEGGVGLALRPPRVDRPAAAAAGGCGWRWRSTPSAGRLAAAARRRHGPGDGRPCRRRGGPRGRGDHQPPGLAERPRCATTCAARAWPTCWPSPACTRPRSAASCSSRCASLIAAWPWLALRVNGKKVAAVGGLIAVGAYLVLSGAHRAGPARGDHRLGRLHRHPAGPAGGQPAFAGPGGADRSC